MDLKYNGVPTFAWGQFIADTSISQTGTYFSEQTNTGMTEPHLLTRNATDAAIAVDINDDIHIIDNEKTINDSFQLAYHYYDNTGWHKSNLQKNKFGFYKNRLMSYRSSVYLMLNRLDNNDPVASSILFTKLSVKTGIGQKNNKDWVNIYPIPFSDQMTIHLTPTVVTDVEILLKDYVGRTIYCIYKGKTAPGNMKFCFNALENKYFKLSAGMYFVYIQMGEKITTHKVLYFPDNK